MDYIDVYGPTTILTGDLKSIEEYPIEQQRIEARIKFKQRQIIMRDAMIASRGLINGTRRVMSITAYSLAYEDCEKMPNHSEYGITASGVYVKPWHTIAAGKSIPFGTRIYIPYFSDKPNKGIFVVQDRGGAIKDNCIDVYMEDKKESDTFGRKKLVVYILPD